MPLDSCARKITLPRYRKQRQAYSVAVPTIAGEGNELLSDGNAPANPGDAPKPRLTSREILQIRELLKRERQPESSAPSIASLAGKYDSETMDAIRQSTREHREKEALAMEDE